MLLHLLPQTKSKVLRDTETHASASSTSRSLKVPFSQFNTPLPFIHLSHVALSVTGLLLLICHHGSWISVNLQYLGYLWNDCDSCKLACNYDLIVLNSCIYLIVLDSCMYICFSIFHTEKRFSIGLDLRLCLWFAFSAGGAFEFGIFSVDLKRVFICLDWKVKWSKTGDYTDLEAFCQQWQQPWFQWSGTFFLKKFTFFYDPLLQYVPTRLEVL